MPRRLFAIASCLSIVCAGLCGCASSGLNLGKPHGFGKGEQWEPDVEADEPKKNDWRSAPSQLRTGKNKESSEGPLDKLIWSDEARDINRSLGGSL